MGELVQNIRDKVLERNTFKEESSFIKTCKHKTGAAALGASLKVLELFVEQI